MQNKSSLLSTKMGQMNTPLHMATYSINSKWYVPKPRRVLPSDDDEVREGFLNAIEKMYPREEAQILRDEWLKFVELRGTIFSLLVCAEDRATIVQHNPLGGWTLYGKGAPNLHHLAVRLLSQVVNSSPTKSN